MAIASLLFLEAFEELTDPPAWECEHDLEELLLAAICLIISVAESWTSVVEWSEMKLDWLRQHCPFANGKTSLDTFGRVFSMLCVLRHVLCVGPIAYAHHFKGKTLQLIENACEVHMTAYKAQFILFRLASTR